MTIEHWGGSFDFMSIAAIFLFSKVMLLRIPEIMKILTFRKFSNTSFAIRMALFCIFFGTTVFVNAEETDGVRNDASTYFLQGLRHVIEHDDLADDAYYSRQLGISMKGTGRQKIYEWGPACGKIETTRYGEYFINLDSPSFIDKSHIFSEKCGNFPYWKEYLEDDRVRVFATIYLDAEKVCIKKEDVREMLSGLDYTHGTYNRDFVYMFGGKNNIGLMNFTSGPRRCIAEITLFQNQNGDERK